MTLEQLRKSDIILLCGLPGAGKSHFARKYFRKSGRKRVNRKEIRKHLYEMFSFNDKWTADMFCENEELLVKFIEKKIIEHILFNNEKVLIDNISVSEKSRTDYISIARKMKKKISAVFLDTELSLCMERNRSQDKDDIVPESLIANLSARIAYPETREGFSEVMVIKNTE